MILEERMYTMHPGKAAEFMKAYQAEGMAIQKKNLGTMFGWFITEVGTQNMIVHMWAYETFEDREKRRAKQANDPEWAAYTAKVRPFIFFQETRIMKPAPFFEPLMRKMLDATSK